MALKLLAGDYCLADEKIGLNHSLVCQQSHKW